MITAFSFGRMVIDGVTYTNDVKIIQNMVVPDWWRKSGHSVDVDDVHDILNYHPHILVIGKGDPGFMTTSAGLRKVLAQESIELIEEKTTRAIQIFNQVLEEDRRVAAGFHVAC
jgi:hypothetical protein